MKAVKFTLWLLWLLLCGILVAKGKFFALICLIAVQEIYNFVSKPNKT